MSILDLFCAFAVKEKGVFEEVGTCCRPRIYIKYSHSSYLPPIVTPIGTLLSSYPHTRTSAHVYRSTHHLNSGCLGFTKLSVWL